MTNDKVSKIMQAERDEMVSVSELAHVGCFFPFGKKRKKVQAKETV